MGRLGQTEADLERTLAALPPSSGAVVMGTGIVSIALSLDGHETLAQILLGVAAFVWVALAALLIGRTVRDRPRFDHEARSPAALAGVAGTAVLGTGFTLLGWDWAGVSLLALAVFAWAALLAPVLSHWTTPTVGVSLLLTVATESLAVLAATLAVPEHARWLLYAALAPFLLGLVFYLFVIARFDFGQLERGCGDQWITGGALAIASLAAARITLDTRALATLGGDSGALKGAALVLWGMTILWLPGLVLAEARRPRLHYDVRRWSTVFPLGMYAASSFTLGTTVHTAAITSFARVWIWVALAVWLIVFAAMLHHAPQIARGQHPPIHPSRILEIAPTRHRAPQRSS
ncbi:MAG TPA: tellurite resistance/C4-dicarboxylate transporter family protein [Solirubrobacteraceae bacterium]